MAKQGKGPAETPPVVVIGTPPHTVEPTPGEPAPAPVATAPKGSAPEGVRKKIAGQEFVVPPDLAAALDQREQDFQVKLGESSAAVGELRRVGSRIQELEQRVNAPPKVEEPVLVEPKLDYEGYEKLLYENPAQAHRMRDTYDKERWDYMMKLQDQREKGLKDQYAQDQRKREDAQQWNATIDRFYAEHPDLDGLDGLVDQEFKKMAERLTPMFRGGQGKEANVLLAEAVRNQLLPFIQKTGKPARAVEGSSGAPAAGYTPPEEVEEQGAERGGLVAAIKEKQSRRRGAHSRPRAVE